MKRIVAILMCVLIGGITVPGIAQVADSTKKVEDDLERAFEELEDDNANSEDFALFLQDLAANPININRASIDDLIRIPGSNIRIAQAIIAYRKNTKPFESIEELLKVKGLGRTTFERMKPYVTVGDTREQMRDKYFSPNYWLYRPKASLMTRYQQVLQEQAGFTDRVGSPFLGSPGRYFQRYQYSTQHLSFNLTQEKDPGEQFFQGDYGFDFTSAHLALVNNGKLKTLVVGDYGLTFGQGLVLWTGAAFGKGRSVIEAVERNERGLRPYSSAMESGFWRGVAFTYGDELQLTAWFSSNQETATIVGRDSVRFPSNTGFHRTQTEIDRRNNTNLMMTGARLRYLTPIGFVGLTGYYAEFDKTIVRNTALSNLYDFQGRSLSTIGADYRLVLGEVTAFGEVAQSQNGGKGMYSGILYPLTSRTEFSMAYRNYEANLQSVFGNGFSESGIAPRNEIGVYSALRHTLTDKIVLSAFYDQFRFPTPRFGTFQATQGNDMLGLIEYTFSRRMNVYVLARYKVREENFRILDEFGREINQIGDFKRTSLRTQLEYQVSPPIRLRSRVEMVRASAPNRNAEYGVLVFQDIRWIVNRKWRLDVRYSMFDTDSFDSRVYQFENDLLYVLSNPALSGRGRRFYILAKYAPMPRLDLWAKYDFTIFEDIQSISSGNTQILGNKRSHIGIQARYTM